MGAITAKEEIDTQWLIKQEIDMKWLIKKQNINNTYPLLPLSTKGWFKLIIINKITSNIYA